MSVTGLRSYILSACSLGFLAAATVIHAQDVEPRVLSPAPVGTNIVGLTLAYSSGAVLLDKTVPVENLDGSTAALAFSYTRYLNTLGLTSRLTGALSFATGEWTGLLGDTVVSASAASRTGLGDPTIAMLVFVAGAPPMKATEFRDFRRKTILGFSLRVRVPLGQYDPEKPINLGSNRWQVAPGLALNHRMGKWTAEGYAAVWFFTENTEFLGDNVLSQDPMLAFQLNLVYSIKPRFWLATGLRQTAVGKTAVNGQEKDNEQENSRLGLVLGFPIGSRYTLKLIGTTGLHTTAGNDFDTLNAQLFYAW